MMFDGGWPFLTRGRAILLILALLGLGYLLLQTMGPNQSVVSRWSPTGLNSVAGALPAPAANQPAPLTGQGLPAVPDDTPVGNPLRNPATVMTQGYGVGSHAPAAIWGGVDLAIDGDGNGSADPGGTMGAPIYATHSGVASVRPNTWPAGNYLAIVNDRYKTAFAHLSDYAVENGQTVTRGQLIGYVGSTGNSSGPHLHYEVWQDGANVNPLDFGALEGTK